jgi:hypothetical protein
LRNFKKWEYVWRDDTVQSAITFFFTVFSYKTSGCRTMEKKPIGFLNRMNWFIYSFARPLPPPTTPSLLPVA